MNTVSDYVIFQRAFAQHYAYSQFFQHFIAYGILFHKIVIIIIVIIIRSPSATPKHFIINLTNGTVDLQNQCPRYLIREHEIVVDEQSSEMPFRLTRNLVSFMGDHGVVGPFRLSIGSYALVGESRIISS